MATLVVNTSGDGGSNLNGGGTEGSADIGATTGSVTGTNFAASAGTPFSGCSVGDLIGVYTVASDTEIQCYGEISAINNSGADVDVTAWVGGTPSSVDTARVNGAFADPGFAAQLMGNGDYCYVKSGTYTITTETPGAAGPVSFGSGVECTMEGYDTTPGDRCDGGSLPLLQVSGSLTPTAAMPIVDLNGSTGNRQACLYLIADGNSRVNTRGFIGGSLSNDCTVGCKAVNNAGYGLSNVIAVGCLSQDNSGRSYNECAAWYSIADGGSDVGFYGKTQAFCVAMDCATGFDDAGGDWLHCVSYSNSGDGFSCGGNNVLINCIAYDDGAFAFDTRSDTMLINCAHYNTHSGRTDTTPAVDLGGITLTGDPFEDYTTLDFTLDPDGDEYDDLAGGGVGLYEWNPSQWGLNRHDIGAVQHADLSATEIAEAMWSDVTSPNRTLTS